MDLLEAYKRKDWDTVAKVLRRIASLVASERKTPRPLKEDMVSALIVEGWAIMVAWGEDGGEGLVRHHMRFAAANEDRKFRKYASKESLRAVPPDVPALPDAEVEARLRIGELRKGASPSETRVLDAVLEHGISEEAASQAGYTLRHVRNILRRLGNRATEAECE